MFNSSDKDMKGWYCYSYQRISSMKQRKGGGIDRQLEQSRAYCEERGWILDTSFKLTDIGKSAFHRKNLDDNAALGQFLKASREGLIQKPCILLVESLDRLSRDSVVDALELFLGIIKSGITICTYTDNAIYNRADIQSNFTPLMASIIYMARSHDESLMKSKRAKADWAKRRAGKGKNGLIHPHIYPFWIDISSGKPVVIERKARMIRELFNLTIHKNYSLNKLIDYMKENYPEDAIGHGLLRLVFNQKKVLGIYEPKVVKEDGSGEKESMQEQIHAFPAIIDSDTYYQARVAIKNRKTLSSGRPVKGQINFFRSILRCGNCGYTVVSSATTKHLCRSRYYCQRHKLRSSDCDMKAPLAVAYLQPVLLQALAVVSRDDLLVGASTTKRNKLRKELTAIEAEIEDKQKRLDNLVELAEEGVKTAYKKLKGLEEGVESATATYEAIKQELKILETPALSGSLEHINAFHNRFSLGEAGKDDQIPFITAVKGTIRDIEVFNGESEGERARLIIILRNELKIRVTVFKDYSANVYKGRSVIMRIAARKQN